MGAGAYIRNRLYGLWNFVRRLSRARYFRGHGVHSPFVYGLVREVFMERRLRGDDRTLRDRLLALGVSSRRALQLQNLMRHCRYTTFTIDKPGGQLVLLTPALDEAAVRRLCDGSAASGTTLAVLWPYASRARERLCRELVAGHRSTSVDNRGYLLVFNNGLPKQHFRI